MNVGGWRQEFMTALLAQIQHNPDLKTQRGEDRCDCDVILTVAGGFHLVHPVCLCLSPGTGQEESAGGDQSLHHAVPGQRGVPDQCLSQQCAATTGHPGLATASHGVFY